MSTESILNLTKSIENIENNLSNNINNLQNNLNYLQLDINKIESKLIKNYATNIKLSRYYLGNFKYYKLKNDGTFEINTSNNRLIEVFQNERVIGYFFKGIYDKDNKNIINEPKELISNIGYMYIDNNNILGKIRAGEKAGKGALEVWNIVNNGNTIMSHYSINGNDDNEPVLWIGEFNKIDNI